MADLNAGWPPALSLALLAVARAGSTSFDGTQSLKPPAESVWVAELRPPLRSGQYESAVRKVPAGFRTAVASWNATTPAGTWIEISLRAQRSGRWTAWYDMGHWSAALSRGHRHSVNRQQDADGRVETDTLTLHGPAQAFQVRAALMREPDAAGEPSLRLIALATDPHGSDGRASGVTAGARGKDLPVPERSQRTASPVSSSLGGGGDAWCSPASVSMIMAYWAAATDHPAWDVSIESAASGTYDPVYDGCGNWPFNVAFASEHGLEGWVQRFSGLTDIEGLVAAGIPVIASIKCNAGELTGAPYEKTAGHLLVVRGFTESGDVVVNEPYALPGGIRRVYRRAQFEHAWLTGSQGAVYLIAPPGMLPRMKRSGGF